MENLLFRMANVRLFVHLPFNSIYRSAKLAGMTYSHASVLAGKFVDAGLLYSPPMARMGHGLTVKGRRCLDVLKKAGVI